MDNSALETTLDNLLAQLLARRTPGGWWEGRLASSALSTATAVEALAIARPNEPWAQEQIEGGLAWLARTQNSDGGWGDTILSNSNISTTSLCWAAFQIAGRALQHGSTVLAAEAWIERAAGGPGPERLRRAIIAAYGSDHTFSVPILTVLALAGRLGEGRSAWRAIPQLPFELAACPHQWFRWLRLPVVSYALPALIAIGQVRHHEAPTRNPLLRFARNRMRRRTLDILQRIQPESGGFLEAVPLTSFVTMTLAAAGESDHQVVHRGLAFLSASARPDGSWPIDTNLATWVTTLSINALSLLPPSRDPLAQAERESIRRWLLDQQYRVEHPYTHTPPGGWAWTDLSGGVPDADDTPGALLALRHLGPIDDEAISAAEAGVAWLLGLQNRDGGIPTFCRGWGKLPFDRSSPDLTAHTLQAWRAWLEDLSPHLRARVEKGIERARDYLTRVQRDDGAWVPLWFGNQDAPGQENPTYGTARCLLAFDKDDAAAKRAVRYLLNSQNADGGWGGAAGTPSSVEETGLVIQALSSHAPPGASDPIARGIEWLVNATSHGASVEPAPIGLYFARLWYFEEMYPLIFSVAAVSARASAEPPPHRAAQALR
ncbi:MAG: prenyltransferase/squalene oxidase repeat-containing protein [Bryobacteraceae bacterium]